MVKKVKLLRFRILCVFVSGLLLSSLAIAQAPPAPAPLYTGTFGGGLAMTGGNTDTNNFNLTAALVRDPKTQNVIKANATYLRGDQNKVLNLDRPAFKVSEEYTVSGRTFDFGQLDYQMDMFQDITFFLAPTAGVGYKLNNTDPVQFNVYGGAGGVLEKNPGVESSKTGSVTAGQRFTQRLSSAAALTESLSSIWKTN